MPPYSETIAAIAASAAGDQAQFHKYSRAESQNKTVYRIIYCPSTDSTYEGHILSCVPSRLVTDSTVSDSDGPLSSTNKGKKMQPSLLPRAHYVKHGKGLLHDYSAGMAMTIDGYFQNDQVIGHALQTLYDASGRHVMALYEGSFTLQSIYLRHGKGKYTWQHSNDVYSGEFSMGAMQGTGTFVWGNGDRYEGSFKKGFPWGTHGKKSIEATGGVFQGSFKKGRMHGWGRKYFGNGDVFCGMYSRDVRKGFGRYAWNNGDVFVGNWENGCTTGRGVKSIVVSIANRNSCNTHDSSDAHILLHTPTQGSTAEVYSGEWDKDEAHGSGVKQYACGDAYYGDFENNNLHGHGIYTWSNGDFYEGEFVDGSCSGQGMKFMNNGDVYDGGFFQDKAFGYGVKTFANGDIYMGHYHNDERHGYGLISWANGDHYEGDFEDGEQSGFGQKRWRNLSGYRGQWYKGKKSGPGFMIIDCNGTDIAFFEVWKRGKRLSRKILQTSWDHVPSPKDLRNKDECLKELLNALWISQI